MNKVELYENTVEEIKDGINVLQLLREELSQNKDDGHIIRSVSVTEKILQGALSNLQRMKED